MSKIIKTFEEWCIENNRQDLLDRWDYKLNSCLPSEIGCKSNSKYWFKCPRGIHESELQDVQYFASGRTKNMYCEKCRSFAQHYIDKNSKELLDYIWSEDNEKSPWDYAYKSNKTAKFVCRENSNHVYPQSIINYINDSKCPYCLNRTGESLLERYPEVVDYWSDKNEDSPDNYGICSREQKWWKCENGVHEDFQRSIIASRNYGFMCSACKRETKCAVNFKDITGMRFGELTVICADKEKTKNFKSNSMYWKCKCSCGNEKSILGSHLRNGSIITCGDRKNHRTGEDNYNWKGGISGERNEARTCGEYKKWRKSILELDSYACQCCGAFDVELHAHHIYSFATHKNLRYSVSNGITLCRWCHSLAEPNSFHFVYTAFNNTPEQLETYINNKRKQLGNFIPFNIKQYIAEKRAFSFKNWLSFINADLENAEWLEQLDYQSDAKEPNGSFI